MANQYLERCVTGPYWSLLVCRQHRQAAELGGGGEHGGEAALGGQREEIWGRLGRTGMDWEGLGGTGMNWDHTKTPVWVTGMNWDELGWTGIDWDELGWP